MLEKFNKIYDAEGEVYFAPGRVNLIGEHTDYNGGHVFPCALTIGTYGVARKREDKKLRFYSLNFEHLGVIESSLDDLKPYKEADWTNYPKGVMWAFYEMGMKMDTGMDLMLYGNISNGSGLSSSASVEVLTGYILRDLYGFHIDNRALALIGQFSENKYNGVNCGIMDQFAIAMGKKDHAIFLDTNTLEYQLVPIKLDGIKIVIASSNKKRGLGDSKYNERRSECEHALEELQRYIEIKTLGDLLEDDFEIYKSAINSDVRKKRAKHAVYENRRTMKAVDVEMKSYVRYLHIAAVDVAGNIGPTLHVPIKTVEDIPEIPVEPDYPKEVPLKTEKILLEDTEYVYPAGVDSFYIKADGATEHTVTFAGCVGVYGMADGYVLMILVLLFASIGGVMGIGMVILIMVIAGFSFVLTHLIKCIVKRRRLFQNMAAAFIPHILVGYVLIWIGVMIHVA